MDLNNCFLFKGLDCLLRLRVASLEEEVSKKTSGRTLFEIVRVFGQGPVKRISNGAINDTRLVCAIEHQSETEMIVASEIVK